MLSILPAELLFSIASYLDGHTDTLHLACTCRALYPVLLPKVFTSLDLITHRKGHLSHLVHTLARNLPLAHEVRTLRVPVGWRPASAGVRYEPDVILPVLKSVLGPDDDLSTWDREIQDPDHNDALTVLLLALCPNLQELVLEVHEFSNYTLEWMERIAPLENSFLSKLQNLTVDCSDTDDGLPSSHFLPILALPSLRHFTAHLVCDGGNTDEEYEEDLEFDYASYIPARTAYSNVTHITLKSSCSRRGFADLLAAPRALESFILEYAENPNYADDDGSMHASRFYPPLSRHSERTLQALVLTAESAAQYAAYHDSYTDYDYVGSFAGFGALRVIQMQIAHLLHWHEEWDFNGRGLQNQLRHVLPRSLERLVLDDLDPYDMKGLVATFKDLFSGGKERVPNMVYLEIKGNWMHEHQSTEESNMQPRPIPAMMGEYAAFKEEMGMLCDGVGVEFCLRDLHVEEIVARNRAGGFVE
ncbi:hypothetical protein BJX64DRAFT_277424 [Aspergillus heterothallicus]